MSTWQRQGFVADSDEECRSEDEHDQCDAGDFTEKRYSQQIEPHISASQVPRECEPARSSSLSFQQALAKDPQNGSIKRDEFNDPAHMLEETHIEESVEGSSSQHGDVSSQESNDLLQSCKVYGSSTSPSNIQESVRISQPALESLIGGYHTASDHHHQTNIPLQNLSPSKASECSSILSDVESLPNPDSLLNQQHASQTRRQSNESHHFPDRRNLRQRNPIQLHPYAIEGERYRQTLHARGLKALHLRSQAQSLQQEERESSPRARSPSIFASDHSPIISPVSSTGLEIHSQEGSLNSPTRRFPASQGSEEALVDKDVQFPDMEELLNFQSESPSIHISRIIKQADLQPKFKMPRGYRSYLIAKARAEALKARQTGRLSETDAPLSPPLSGEHHIAREEREWSRNPAIETPANVSLPTPRRSSADISTEDVALRSSDSECQVVDADSGEAASSTGQPVAKHLKETHHLQDAQRRIRGVLPASWLKLDSQHQKRKITDQSAQRAERMIRSKLDERGVARVVAKRKECHEASDPLTNIIAISGEESDEVPESESFPRPSPAALLPQHRLGEAIEDHYVDAMLSKPSRSSHSSKRRRKAQTRLKEMGFLPRRSKGHNLEARLHECVSSDRTPSVQSSGTFRRFSHGADKPLPMLSISDVIGSDGLQQQPSFIKLAARTTRTRRDRGKQRPSHKYIKFVSPEDNKALETTMRDWTRGALSSTANTKGGSRIALGPRNANADKPRPAQKISFGKSSNLVHKISLNGRQISKAQNSDSSLRLSNRPIVNDGNLQEQKKGTTSLKRPTDKSSKRLGIAQCARPAVMESQLGVSDAIGQGQSLKRLLTRANQDSNTASPLLTRFLNNVHLPMPAKHNTAPSMHEMTKSLNNPASETQSIASKKGGKSRKRRPTHLLQPKSHAIDPEHILPDSRSIEALHYSSTRSLIQCRLDDHCYTYTYGVCRLSNDSKLDPKSFIGSSEFAQCLIQDYTNLDQARGNINFEYCSSEYNWGPWNARVAAEIGSMIVFSSVSDSTDDSDPLRCCALRYIAMYIQRNLSFSDPIDRCSFCQSVLQLIYGMDETAFCVKESKSWGSFHAFRMTLLMQLRMIAARDQQCQAFLPKIDKAAEHCGITLLKHLMLRHSDHKQNSEGLSTSSQVVLEPCEDFEAFVMLLHLLNRFPQSCQPWNKISFADLGVSSPCDPSSYESIWARLYSYLPAWQIDIYGKVNHEIASEKSDDCWALVKRLIKPFLDTRRESESMRRSSESSMTTYIRALYSRCLYLIKNWHWVGSGNIIGPLFDFFAHNNLHHLSGEGNHGSPTFLDELSNASVSLLVVDPKDCCFHLLLKIIGLGILQIRQTFPLKKLRDLAFRLLPNHGRNYPKELPVRQEDLDALQNHHDLICTLYRYFPCEARPRLISLQNLVHFPSSHREACRISVRAWTRLIKFQLSTDEGSDILHPLIAWLKELLDLLISQHRTAKVEVENQRLQIQAAQGHLISQRVFEDTIAQNQRQVEAVVLDLLRGLRRAIPLAKSLEVVSLLAPENVGTLLYLHDTSKIMPSTAVVETLDLIKDLVEHSQSLQKNARLLEDEDDSQEYGDWAIFSSQTAVNASLPLCHGPMESLHQALWRLMSNCFGADVHPDDRFLESLVFTWVHLSKSLVSASYFSWHDFLSVHGSFSWHSLRRTQQSRKHYPLFLQRIIIASPECCEENRELIFAEYLSTLVERECLLKHQHDLTSAMLNIRPVDPLLQNLPFCHDVSTGRYSINMTDFCSRRLALLSQILHNMWKFLNEHGSERDAFKRQFRGYLKHSMEAIREVYQDFGYDKEVNGAYVEFVHHVIGMVKQYAAHFYQIDCFFTDSTSFPLPAIDPTYTIDQLKHYALDLQSNRSSKELAIFMQSIFEKAAVDDSQEKIADQLYQAMTVSTYEYPGSKFLRNFFLRDLVPAYATCAVQTPCAPVFVAPVLRISQKLLHDLSFEMGASNRHGGKDISDLILPVMAHLLQLATTYCERPDIRTERLWVRLMCRCFYAMTDGLSLIYFLLRSCDTDANSLLMDLLLKIGEVAAHLSLQTHNPLRSELGHDRREYRLNGMETLLQMSELGTFIATELRQTLQRHWSISGSHLVIRRGQTVKRVQHDVASDDESCRDLTGAIGNYISASDSLFKNDKPSVGHFESMAESLII